MPRRPRLRLQTRLLLTTAAVLAASFGSVGWLLDRAFNAAVRDGAEEELRAICYGLLGMFDEDAGGLTATGDAEPRLQQLNSGYYAYVDDANGRPIWLSPALPTGSALLAAQPTAKRPAVGEFHFDAIANREPPQFVAAYTVNWEVADMVTTLWVLADQAPYQQRLAAARRLVIIGLGTAAALFMLAQLAALMWGMAPLRRMARRVRELEAGSRDRIGDDYPPELSPLAHNLNGFIAAEKASRERYRRAMDDLAHSLKTPLAVMTNALEPAGGEREEQRLAGETPLLREQLQRMKAAVGYQLSRATAARGFGGQRIALAPLTVRVVRALERAHAGKTALVDLPDATATARLTVRGDERDLMEMLGNLIENALKYAQEQVRVSIRESEGEASLLIAVEDDGPGVPPTHREAVLRRGVRADTATDGQGIGLAVVQELADDYQGRLSIADSEDLGGAKFVLSLPAA